MRFTWRYPISLFIKQPNSSWHISLDGIVLNMKVWDDGKRVKALKDKLCRGSADSERKLIVFETRAPKQAILLIITWAKF